MKIPRSEAQGYNIMKFPVVKAVVGCLLIKDDKVLLTKRSKEVAESGKWCFTGGHIDIGETAEEAVRREIKEEVNLTIKDLKFLSYFDEFFPKIKRHSLVLMFEGTPLGEVKIDHESTEFGWFTKEQALKLDLAFKHKEIIERFFK